MTHRPIGKRPEGQIYLGIPKERAASILTRSVSSYEVTKETNKELVVKKTKKTGFLKPPQTRAVITNYKTGQDAKVEYYHNTVYEVLEDYIL